jgi:hypothetical protein
MPKKRYNAEEIIHPGGSTREGVDPPGEEPNGIEELNGSGGWT